ncbi:MAG: class I SAM-dependent methyltransferase [Gemmatimonadota bacterium]
MSAAATEAFQLVCPECRAPLRRDQPDVRVCPSHNASYTRAAGIWRLLPASRAAQLEAFIREYETVRQAEGRGSDDAEFYLRLPFADTTGRFADDWRIRALSYRSLLRHVIRPLSERGALRVLDVGAGNGWLAYRLAEMGHHTAAVDLLVNELDGLGSHVRHRGATGLQSGGSVLPVQADFDRLPFAGGDADIVIFNGSLHYSTSYDATLTEALRVLRPGGRIVVMDSPIYRDGASGEQMVREREAAYVRRYGFASNALPSEQFLTRQRLATLAHRLRLQWRTIEPFYGWRWAVRPYVARILARREPARFAVLVGSRA